MALRTAPFRMVSDFSPAGDQPAAVAALSAGIGNGERYQTLLGITGSCKSATIAWTIEQVQKPTLVIAPNKSLAAQLANEFREFFPDNRVEYFVSYYDYYQPEAYIASSDTYIEKDSSVNDEIDRLRHSATAALLTRSDVIVVASVSWIYGLGSPEEYRENVLFHLVGDQIDQRSFLRTLVDMHYDRNDANLTRGKFRVRGDTIEVHPAYEETILRIELFANFEKHGKLLEAQRLRMRTQYDLEMMQEVGYCNGIENYSGPIDGRAPGETPHTLLDFFPDDYLCVIDESHVAVPQLHGQYEGDRSRKAELITHGFRLPSAADNRPLRFDEFIDRVNQVVFLSATPSPYELEVSSQVVEQIVRPTGLVDPEVVIRPTKGQIDDLIGEINARTGADQRVLVTTLTKKMAEDLTDYLLEQGLRVRYLHSNIDTDKEGFLRSETSLIQTTGRAARNVDGQVIMYADTVTDSMRRAIGETQRRRQLQIAYNAEKGIEPQTIRKAVNDILAHLRPTEGAPVPGGGRRRGRPRAPQRPRPELAGLPPPELGRPIQTLEEEMHEAAADLRFEYAARLRDEVNELKRELREAGV